MHDEGDGGPPPQPSQPPAADPPPPPDQEPPHRTDADGDADGRRPVDEQRAPAAQATHPENFDSWARQSDRAAARDREFHKFGVRPDQMRMYSRITAAGSGSTAAGRDVHRNTEVHGGFAAGRDLHVHTADQPGVTTGVLSPEWVAEAMRSYQESPSYGDALRTIRKYGLVLLTGPDGSGRFRTAVHIAGALCGADRVVSIDLDPKGAFATAFDQADVLREEHAHIVSLTTENAVTRHSLHAVAGKVRDAEGFLVVIGPPDRVVDASLLPYAVRHHAPPADELLRHFLGDRLVRSEAFCVGGCEVCRKACAGPFIERCLSDDEVRKHLALGPAACELDDLAGRLLTAQYLGEPLGSAVGLTYGRLRGIAERVLGKPSPDPVKPSEARHLLRTLAFRVAYAVLNESALNVIFLAARVLYEELSAEYRPNQSAPAAPPFDGKVTDLLHQEMIAGEPELDDGGGGDLRPRLVDPKLTTAMLDVLWNKYDRLRAPLMRWTFQLGRHDLEAVRRRAASVCGQFARWDTFDAYHGLIRKWALADGWTTRHTAAYAMANLAVDPAHTSWVRRQVADWIDAPTSKLNDAAARAYAEIRDSPFAEDVLPNLRVVAAKPELAASFAVPKAVAALAEQQPDSIGSIVAALAEWTDQRSRGQMVQAARSVLFLSTERSPEPDERWPVLLRAAAKDGQTWDQLRGLWCVALSEVLTANHGWTALLAWLLEADGVPGIEDVVVDFTTELCRIPQLRDRAAFRVRWWRHEFPDAAILRRIPPKSRGRR